ncbi:MAG: leucine-rich repeat protein [Methanobacterium sp.]
MDIINIPKALETATEKSLLDYINEFDMTPPEYGFSFLLTNRVKDGGGDYDLYNENYTITIQNTDKYIIKAYDVDNNIVQTIESFSGATPNLLTVSNHSTNTPFGYLTKYSIEPKNTSNPITNFTFDAKKCLAAIVFGANSLNAITDLSLKFRNNKTLVKSILPVDCHQVTTYLSMFEECINHRSTTLPTNMSGALTLEKMYYNNNLEQSDILLPTMDNCASLASTFYNCGLLRSITFPANMPALLSINTGLGGLSSITEINLPAMANVTDLSANSNMINVTEVSYPATLNSLTTLASCLYNMLNLESITLPTSMTALVTFFSGSTAYKLHTMTKCTNYGTNQISANIGVLLALAAFDQPMRCSKFVLTGQSATYPSVLAACEIDWANSTFGGTSPQIDLRYNILDTTELDRILTALPVVTGKTINIASNPGSATCDPTIATAKGWTVTIS